MFFILAQLWSTGFEVHLQTAAFCFPCMCRPSMESHNGCQSDAGFIFFWWVMRLPVLALSICVLIYYRGSLYSSFTHRIL